tara:strand:+ start:457 stop:864 length:408 start_codon:yes stop_codon:yes gene_type:complete
VIADFENVTGEHLSKKYLPEALAKEIEKKPFKIKWIYQCLGISKQAYYKRINANNLKELRDQRALDLVREKRKTHHKLGTRKLIKYIKNGLLENNIKWEETHYLTYLDAMECWSRKPNGTISQQTLNPYSINRQT